MKISYAHECVMFSSPHADLTGRQEIICGELVTITKADCFGLRANAAERTYTHKIIEVETDNDSV